MSLAVAPNPGNTSINPAAAASSPLASSAFVNASRNPSGCTRPCSAASSSITRGSDRRTATSVSTAATLVSNRSAPSAAIFLNFSRSITRSFPNTPSASHISATGNAAAARIVSPETSNPRSDSITSPVTAGPRGGTAANIARNATAPNRGEPPAARTTTAAAPVSPRSATPCASDRTNPTIASSASPPAASAAPSCNPGFVEAAAAAAARSHGSSNVPCTAVSTAPLSSSNPAAAIARNPASRTLTSPSRNARSLCSRLNRTLPASAASKPFFLTAASESRSTSASITSLNFPNRCSAHTASTRASTRPPRTTASSSLTKSPASPRSISCCIAVNRTHRFGCPNSLTSPAPSITLKSGTRHSFALSCCTRMIRPK